MSAGPAVVTLVKVPAVESLTSRQRRGRDCVHCGAELFAGRVTDLGERHHLAHGVEVRWFPRACKPRCAA